MRLTIALLSAVLFLGTPGYSLDKVGSGDIAHHPFEADFPSGGELSLRIRSAEIRIEGSDENKVTVHASGKSGSDSDDINASFERSGNSGELRVTGGPSSNVTITVTVPKKSNLRVRIFAGDVEIEGIKGNKDVELNAGELTIGVGNAADYEHVRASVTTGAIDAAPFGESHGGMFRSFERSGNGKYTLMAHVGSGDLNLK